MVDTTGLSPAAVLAALYNASTPQGMGFLQYTPAPMTEAEATDFLQQHGTYFDYLKGRVMKVNLSSAEQFNEALYDRDNGPGAAQRAIDALRKTANPNAAEMQAAHTVGKTAAAEEILDKVHRPHTTKVEDGFVVVNMGLADVVNDLIPAVEHAIEPGGTNGTDR